MSQNSIDNTTMEIKNDQPHRNDVSLSLDSSFRKCTELGIRTRIFKDFGSNIRSFLGGFCEITAVASILRKKCVVLLSVFLCSGLALEMKMTANLVPVCFCVSYMCLSYQIVENLVRYSKLKKSNDWSQEVACLFEMTHKIALTLFLFALNLIYEGVISEGFMLLTPFIFLLEARLYWRNYSNSRSLNIVTRLFYVLQSLLIAAKMNNLIDLEWRTTLVFVWIYLGINAVYAIFAGFLFVSVSLSSIINYDREYLSILKNEAIGYVWHISYNAFSVFAIVFLIGSFRETEDLVEAGLYFAQKLSLFLGVYTVFLFPTLKNQTPDLFQDLLTILLVQVTPNAGLVPKKYSLVKAQKQSKKEFFLMISSTYFSLLKEERLENLMQANKSNEMASLDMSADKNMKRSQEDNLCYICEHSESNAIIAECGHGGVCCDCIVKSIRCKNECMECRKPAKAIYKIESESKTRTGIIVETSEFVQVVEV